MSELRETLLSAVDGSIRIKTRRILEKLAMRKDVRSSRTPAIPWHSVGGLGELFDYQEELRRKAFRCLSAREDGGRGLIAIPTGGGKTRTASVVIRDLVEKTPAKTIYWVAPGLELLWQAREALTGCWRRRDIGRVEMGGIAGDTPPPRDPETPTILFVTAQWLGKRGTGPLPPNLPTADLIVFDEAHHAVAPSYLEGLEALASHGRKQGRAPLLGLSATPGRMGEGGTRMLAEFFERRLLVSETLGRDPVRVLQDRGVLAQVSFCLVAENHERLHRVLDWSARPNTNELARDPHRFKAILDHIANEHSRGRMLVFASSIDHADIVVAALIAMGIRSAAVTSATSHEDRERFLRWFQEGRISVLVNKDLLTTGFDLPAIRSVFLTVPVLSPIRFEQIVGRAIRGPAVGGSEHAEVFQFERHETLHGDLESYSRFWDVDWRPQ